MRGPLFMPEAKDCAGGLSAEGCGHACKHAGACAFARRFGCGRAVFSRARFLPMADAFVFFSRGKGGVKLAFCRCSLDRCGIAARFLWRCGGAALRFCLAFLRAQPLGFPAYIGSVDRPPSGLIFSPSPFPTDVCSPLYSVARFSFF